MATKVSRTVDRASRRRVLKHAAAAVGGAASLMAGPALASQAGAPPTPSAARQRFRAFVRSGTRFSLQELILLPIAQRQVVIRVEASQVCYTTTTQALGTA